MAEKNSFSNWLGFATPPNWLQSRALGGFLGGLIVLAILIFSVASLAVFQKFVISALSSQANTQDTYNLGLLLGALIGAPFVAWRSLVNHKQANISEQIHISEQLNIAVANLSATQSGTIEKDIPTRTSAALSLKKIAFASPDDSDSILRVLGSQLAAHNDKKPENKSLWYSELQSGENIIRRLGGTGHMPSPEISELLNSMCLILESFPPNKHIEIANICLSDYDLQSLNITMFRLLDCNFHRSSLKSANLSKCFVIGGKFEDTDLSGADLSEAYINGHFNRCLFWGTKLNETTLQECTFDKAAFYNCDLSKLAFPSNDAKERFSEAIRNTLGDVTTILPEGVTRPSNWPTPEKLSGKSKEAFEKSGFVPLPLFINDYNAWLGRKA